MKRRRIIFTLALLLAVYMLSLNPVRASVRSAQASATASATPDSNLLLNGDFEGVFTRQWNPVANAWANGRVASGWTAWWRQPTDSDGDYPGACAKDIEDICQAWHVPEYRETRGIPYTPPRIRSGENSQMMFATFGLFEGGLYQKVSGLPITWHVRFSLWVRAWSSDDTQDTFNTKGQPSMHMRLGIDPLGGTDPLSPSVIWGETFDAFDAFSQHSIDAQLQADAVTVFFRAVPERALKHIDVMLDDAELILFGAPAPTIEVIDAPSEGVGLPELNSTPGAVTEHSVVHVIQVGDSLFAIAQLYNADLNAIYARNGLDETSLLEVGQSIVVPLPVDSTPTPVPAPTVVPEPERGGLLCVRTFVDAAGDGRYDANDGDLPGVSFVVSDATGRRIANAESPECFDRLPVGAYQIAMQMPAGYTATTELVWGVALTADTPVDVLAGARAPLIVNEPDDATLDGSSIVAGSGMVLLLAALAVLTIVYRRRRDEE